MGTFLSSSPRVESPTAKGYSLISTTVNMQEAPVPLSRHERVLESVADPTHTNVPADSGIFKSP